MRQYIPKKYNFAELTDDQIYEFQKLNFILYSMPAG
jgi:IS30 family transposase